MIRSVAFFVGLTLLATPALANSFMNGGFEILTNGPGELGYSTDAVGWTTTGYNFAYVSGTADTTGSISQYGSLRLWGPNNGSNNGFTATSPSGGNFVAADGNYRTQPISQLITGLKVGRRYTIGYDFAFGQQFGYDGDTIQRWTSSFGGTSVTTADHAVPDHGFAGWFHTSYTAMAMSTNETLSFLAYGNVAPPPFALLDGVTVTSEVPEPATWVLLVTAFGLVGIAARIRRVYAAAA